MSTSIEAILLTGAGDREYQAATPSSTFPAKDTMVQIYNSARAKVGTSVQGLLHRIASRMPSYPDLSAFLPSSPFWIDSPLPQAGDDVAAAAEADDMGRMQQQAATAVYAETLSHALSQPLLMPFIERADRVEVQYATLLADLSNMAYEANKVGGRRDGYPVHDVHACTQPHGHCLLSALPCMKIARFFMGIALHRVGNDD